MQISEAMAQTFIETLTHDDSKLHLYSQDLDYRIPEEILMRKGVLTRDELYDYTFLVLHPEVFAGRFQETVVDKLLENGFSIAAVDVVPFDLNQAKGIWKYQWNAAAVERMLFFALKSRLSTTAILYLRSGANSLPATLRLHELKGSSRFTERIKPNQFRSVLPFTNRAMTFIHCPDEPADFLRELSVLWPIENWPAIMERLKTGTLTRESAINFLDSLCEDVDFRDFTTKDEKYIYLWNSYLCQSTREHALLLYEDLSPADKWRALASAANAMEYDVAGAKPIITTRHMPEVVERWQNSGRK